MRSIIHLVWLLAAVALATGVTPSKAAAQCLQCELCPGTEHKNVQCPWCFIGTDGGEHTACWAFSCGSTHEQNVACGQSLAALDALREVPELRESTATQLDAEYGDRVAYSPSGEYLQVYDCKGERVMAQFPIVT